MSVLIKGMEMPKTCWECSAENRLNVYVIVFGGHCPFRERIVPIEEFDAKTGRHPSCPLIEVPTPHGRLIDADKLDRAFSDLRWQDGDWQTGEMVHWGDRSDWCLQGIEVETLIKNAPTIIEAEEDSHE